MSDLSSFLLIPNHSLAVVGQSGRIESAEADMLRAMEARFSRLGIVGFVTEEKNSSLSGDIDFSRTPVHKLNLVEHSHSGFFKIINYLYAASRMPLFINRYDFLYIFCPGYCGLVAALWARLLGKRYGVYVRGTWLTGESRTPIWWEYVFSGADFLIVTGESFRMKLQKYCRNVVNEVPLTALRPHQVDVHWRSDSSALHLVFVGRLSESKGIHDVVRALAILRREGRDVELVVAGGGIEEEVEALVKLQDQLGVKQAVKVLGHVSSAVLADVYKNSGVFVFPSYYAEGFPRVLYEAMMYSLAIVTCEMPGTEGFLIDEENCLYCRPADPINLADRLRCLIDDQKLSRRLGSKAREDVEKLYDSFVDDSHAQQILRFINR